MKSLVILILLSFHTFGFSQVLEEVTSLPVKINESSALEVINAKLWTLNDGGGEPELYQVDMEGNITRTIRIAGVVNRDWEELATDDKGNIYIGEFGNNNNNIDNMMIYKISNPELQGNDTFKPLITYFSYEDQNAYPPKKDSLNFDCEAMIWYHDSIYLFTKHRTLPMATNIYVLPAEPGSYTARKIAHFETGEATESEHPIYSYWITAADISPDFSRLALLSGDKMWVFYDYTGTDFFNGKHVIVPLLPATQKEALVFLTNDEIYISDELWAKDNKGGKVYKININSLIK